MITLQWRLTPQLVLRQSSLWPHYTTTSPNQSGPWKQHHLENNPSPSGEQPSIFWRTTQHNLENIPAYSGEHPDGHHQTTGESIPFKFITIPLKFLFASCTQDGNRPPDFFSLLRLKQDWAGQTYRHSAMIRNTYLMTELLTFLMS